MILPCLGSVSSTRRLLSLTLSSQGVYVLQRPGLEQSQGTGPRLLSSTKTGPVLASASSQLGTTKDLTVGIILSSSTLTISPSSLI